jgi:uncharacterized protein
MMVFLITVLLLFLYWAFNKAHKNTKDIVINKIYVEQDGVQGSQQSLNILHLSDLHLENISISPEELFDRLKEEEIELVALTGDFLDRTRTIPKLGPYLKAIQRLNAKHGMYAVLGNHDYKLNKDSLHRLITTLKEHGCTVLQNENTSIVVDGKILNIIGIDDNHTHRSDVAASYSGIQQKGTNLVLTHDPNIVLKMKNYHFEYLLSGHFHGGQICYPKAYHLIKMGKLIRMNMVKGLHKHEGKLFYINEGLGQTGINIRVGSRPEITLHQFPISAAVKKAAAI